MKDQPPAPGWIKNQLITHKNDLYHKINIGVPGCTTQNPNTQGEKEISLFDLVHHANIRSDGHLPG
jgi:hypothetical protein